MIARQDDDPADPRPRRLRLRNVALGMFLGMIATVVVAVVILVIVFRRNQLPRVTFEILDAAAARWAAEGPENYALDIALSGVNPGAVHVEVRRGEVTQVTLDGRPIRPHTWDDWSVPGLFSVIRRDLEVCMAHEQPVPKEAEANQPTAPPVFPRGTFDTHYGYPTEYLRVTTTGADSRFRVRRFAVE